MTNHPLTDHYNRLRAGAIEYSTEFGSGNADVITARRRAIEEGRLTVIRRGSGDGRPEQQEPGDDPQYGEDCLGCEYAQPILDDKVFDTWASGVFSHNFPIFGSDSMSVSGAFAGPPSGRTISLRLEGIQVIGANGTCEIPEGGVCQQKTPCSFSVGLTFGGSCDAGLANLPTISFGNPFTPAGTPVAVAPTNLTTAGTGTRLTMEYVVWFPVGPMTCGQSLQVNISAASVPMTAAGWTFSDADPGKANVLRLTCEVCGNSEGDPQ